MYTYTLCIIIIIYTYIHTHIRTPHRSPCITTPEKRSPAVWRVVPDVYVRTYECTGVFYNPVFHILQIFERMRTECPDFLSKVAPIIGDCAKPNLGIHENDRNTLISETDIIFHIAATVRFDGKSDSRDAHLTSHFFFTPPDTLVRWARTLRYNELRSGNVRASNRPALGLLSRRIFNESTARAPLIALQLCPSICIRTYVYTF